MTNEITPKEWVLPNRIGYNEKVYKNFNPELYSTKIDKAKCKCEEDVCDLVEDAKISLFPQQRFIRDYIQFNSPYRGALLYHELGSGKSGASIAAAEGYINKKKIFVLSPASLAVNYENEILKISSIGLNLKKDWTQIKITKTDKTALEILKTKYFIDSSIIKKDGVVWIPIYNNDIPNSVILKRTADADDKLNITAMTSHIIKNRYTFISYNGLSPNLIKNLGPSPFDNAFIIIDEVHNFISRIVNGSKLARIIYGYLMEAKDAKLILLSGTPMINNPYEIATLINLIRGYMVVYELSYAKTSKTITTEEFIQNNKYNNVIDEFTINNEARKIFISLLPHNFKRNDKNEIIQQDWGFTLNKMIDNIISSLNSIKGIKINVKFNSINFSALPNSRDEFNKYFLDMADEDNPKVMNEDLFMRRILGTVSYYSISGSELFPSVLPTIKRELKMTDTQFKAYAEQRNYEIKQDLNKKKGQGLFSENTSVYRAFTRAVCNFSFPEDIKRVYPKDIKKFIRDNNDDEYATDDEEIYGGAPKDAIKKMKEELKKLKEISKKSKEDLKQLKEIVKKAKEDKKPAKELKVMAEKVKVLNAKSKEDAENVKELNTKIKELEGKKPKKDDDEDEEEDVVVNVNANVNVADEYGNQMKIMMDKLIKSNALDLDNLKKNYSPKFAQILTDVEESPGSVLIYSSFRTLEGLGILSEVLNRQGYKQILLKKVDNNYLFADSDIFDTKYDNKRYIIFDSDKEKTKLLMNLFNNDFRNITNEMKKALPPNPSQLYGNLAKIFCITQSGAEGISLKNVRRVLLVEPFWNNVRIEQVIGRAIRSCSHEALPKSDRNVQVFSYIMKLTPKQIQSDYTIERNDKGLSTDEHILMTAEKKKTIINKFLNMLKSASFDCVIHSKQNKPLANDFKCYSWALGVNYNDLAYTNNISDDYKIMKHKNMQVKKVNKGRVVMKKGKKFIELENKYYDYFSYINAGILVPENI